MTANNSCGQRSIHYGTMRHNVQSIEAILPNGSNMKFGEVASTLDGLSGEDHSLAANLLALGARDAQNIQQRFPNVLRRVGGYNVDALTHKSAGISSYNLSHLLVGSEGTLAYSTEIELKLSTLPAQRVLGVCHFPNLLSSHGCNPTSSRARPACNRAS